MTTTPIPTEAEVDELYGTLSNWGRWGADDELGALNHLTAERRVAAVASVRDGHSVSLAHNLPVIPTPENPYPAEHHMLAAADARDNTGLPGYEATRDYVGGHVHGLGVTHIDALCHIMVRGRMYNDIPASEVRSDGARRNTVMALADGLVGRGVLLDIARVRGTDHLEAADPVTLADLEAAEKAQGVEVGPGDILLVGTGRDTWRRGGPLNPMTQGMAGLHAECLRFLHEREVAVLGSDGISDPMPGLGIPNWPFPIHQVGIAGLGLHLIDNVNLGAAAAYCAQVSRWSFLLTLAPLRVVGGTGCPVNPVAVF